MRHARTSGTIVGLAVAALLATACSDGLEDEGPGARAAVEPGGQALDGASITVGSKDVDEQLVLGHVSRLLLEDAGVGVTDAIDLGGTEAARAALESGEIDHYWEYTGTAWTSFLGEGQPIPDRVEQYEAVRDLQAEHNGLYWLEPTPFNDTYGIAHHADAAADLGDPDSISDLFELAEEEPDLATLCVEPAFETHDDGLPGLEEHYGGEILDGNVTALDAGVVYGAVADRDPCNFGEVYTTDGRIAALELVVLEDDRSFFPFYNAAPVFTEEVFERYGQALADLYDPVTAELDEETMARLNARVAADDEDPAEVARDFLEDVGAI